MYTLYTIRCETVGQLVVSWAQQGLRRLVDHALLRQADTQALVSITQKHALCMQM